MPKPGAHQSIAGGFENAVIAAANYGFETVQLFSKNSNQWNAKPIDDESAAKFIEALKKTGIVKPLIHDSYLINLASPKEDLLAKSQKAFADELRRAAVLGIDAVVMHPGSYTDDTPENGLKRIADSLVSILAETPAEDFVLLETTAGQGTNLGSKFEHLADIIDRADGHARLGVCIDTCHIFAAGYDFTTKEKYEQVMDEFDRVIGLNRLRAFHLNDSVKELGKRIDRHAHIGYGAIGAEPFGFILNDPRLAELPMYLETPKGETDINGTPEDWDAVNLKTLRALL